MSFEEDFKIFPFTFHSHKLDCDQSATYWPICTRFYTDHHLAIPRDHEHLCENLTVFCKDTHDYLFSTQCAYISGILWTIKILLITFCQEGPHMVHSKFGANWSNRLGGVQKMLRM